MRISLEEAFENWKRDSPGDFYFLRLGSEKQCKCQPVVSLADVASGGTVWVSIRGIRERPTTERTLCR
jgi:hypothetical protein